MTDLAHIRHLIHDAKWSTARAEASGDVVALEYVRAHAARAEVVEVEVVPHGDLRDGGAGPGERTGWRVRIEPPECDGAALDTWADTLGGYWVAGDGPTEPTNARDQDFNITGDNMHDPGDIHHAADGTGDGYGASTYGIGTGDGGDLAETPF